VSVRQTRSGGREPSDWYIKEDQGFGLYDLLAKLNKGIVAQFFMNNEGFQMTEFEFFK